MKTTKEWEEFYTYAERNIRNYKRPADYLERIERVLKGELKSKPMKLQGEQNEH